ncbi:MAG: winged helix-turn-helix transcriptional regulator, partial [Halobacteriales archaeon]|nr:winged helix-turn-helix transcriptional regulator [Halobacteriales archaeon]
MLALAILRPRGDATRARILDAIRKRPGLNKNQLRRAVGLAWTTTEYHLRILARQGFLLLDPQARDVRLFAVGIPARFRPWFAALLNDNRLRILRELESGELPFKTLRDRLAFDEDNLRRILGQMITEGVLVKRGRFRPRYAIHPE